MESINLLLASADLQYLYTNEEVKEITNTMLPSVPAPTRINIMREYHGRVRENLHVVVALSGSLRKLR